MTDLQEIKASYQVERQEGHCLYWEQKCQDQLCISDLDAFEKLRFSAWCNLKEKTTNVCSSHSHCHSPQKKKVRESRACSCAGRPTLTMNTRSQQPIQPHTSHPKKQRAILTAHRISELRAVYVPCLYCPRFKYSETLSSALMAVQITPHSRCGPPSCDRQHNTQCVHRTPNPTTTQALIQLSFPATWTAHNYKLMCLWKKKAMQFYRRKLSSSWDFLAIDTRYGHHQVTQQICNDVY